MGFNDLFLVMQGYNFLVFPQTFLGIPALSMHLQVFFNTCEKFCLRAVNLYACGYSIAMLKHVCNVTFQMSMKSSVLIVVFVMRRALNYYKCNMAVKTI